jgi:hypothetical protein
MQEQKGRGGRRNEVTTGLLLILLATSYVASLLLDFKFVSPYATLQEDLSYLTEHILSQKLSSLAWLITALTTALTAPFYFFLFRKKLKMIPYLNTLFMLCASTGFLLMSLSGLGLHREISGLLTESIELSGDQMKLQLLDQFRKEQFYRLVGSSFVGAWSLGLSLSRFRIPRFPLVSSILLMISGPALIFFNWYEPEHLGHTGAMAGIIVGVAVFCVRLINKGLATYTNNPG